MSRFCLAFITVLFLVCSFGCSTYPVRPMPAVQATEAPARASWGAAQLGAKPYLGSAELKAVFNRDLMSKGVLPVLLVVDNTRSSSEIEILRGSIELATPAGSRLAPIGSDSASTGQERNAMAEAIFFFGIFSYDNANKYNDEMRRDWVDKGFPEVAVVMPGRSLSKFLYFNVGKDFKPSGASLLVPARVANAAARQTVALPF